MIGCETLQIDYNETARFLLENDNYNILIHQSPDGDTIGSGFALCFALRKLGKKANVLCSDEFPMRYKFIHSAYSEQDFDAKTIVAVDVADVNLLGTKLSEYGDKVDLCIDHHKSNTNYAGKLLLDAKASAACQVLYEVFICMDNLTLDTQIASCIYTGIATDTGCFKFSNTTKRSHIIAAELMGYDIPYEYINRLMFDVKSKARIMVENYITSSMEYYLDDRCSVIAVTSQTIADTNASEDDFEGLSNLALQLESVMVGVTIKERKDGKFKVSMRSSSHIDVSDICADFGGGGHSKAAGCLIDAPLQEVKNMIISAIKTAIGE